ncbi:hypothetical protein Fmac_001593 [Flemingia macrophylla]|uniref:Uncharacterized protein n=1 Tax=Flemingia macrophylla TaxID=520843 RepID=A0ABD1NHJ3_9FABA
MVMRGSEQQPRPNFMAPSPKGSNPLHSSSFPFLNWGKNRRIRSAATGCDGGDHRSSASNSDESTATPSKESVEKQPHGGDEDGIAVRRRSCEALESEKEKSEGRGSGARRQRRNQSPPVRHDGASRLPQLRSASEKTEKVKFSLQLSKKEIEEDFMAMLGHLPPRRPNKRPKHVQKQLDVSNRLHSNPFLISHVFGFPMIQWRFFFFFGALCPGLWLAEVTADSYKVIEAAENGNVRHHGKRKVDAGF